MRTRLVVSAHGGLVFGVEHASEHGVVLEVHFLGFWSTFTIYCFLYYILLSDFEFKLK